MDPPCAENMEGAADSEADEVPAEEPEEVTTSTPVGSLRNELREGLVTSETAGLIRDAILAGLKATKNFWVTCPHCNKRHETQAPDLGVRVNAAEKLLDQLEGRLRAEAATLDQKVAEAQRQSEQDLASCTDQELMLLVVAENAGRFLSVKESAQQLAAKVIADASVSA